MGSGHVWGVSSIKVAQIQLILLIVGLKQTYTGLILTEPGDLSVSHGS